MRRVWHPPFRRTSTGWGCDHDRNGPTTGPAVGRHCVRGAPSRSAHKGHQARGGSPEGRTPARPQVPPPAASSAPGYGRLRASQTSRRCLRRRLLLARLPRPLPRRVPRAQRRPLGGEDRDQQRAGPTQHRAGRSRRLDRGSDLGVRDPSKRRWSGSDSGGDRCLDRSGVAPPADRTRVTASVRRSSGALSAGGSERRADTPNRRAGPPCTGPFR